jgi:hypothetical protein
VLFTSGLHLKEQGLSFPWISVYLAHADDVPTLITGTSPMLPSESLPRKRFRHEKHFLEEGIVPYYFIESGANVLLALILLQRLSVVVLLRASDC